MSETPKRPRGRPRKNPLVDLTLLSNDEQTEIRAKAKAKVLAERKLASEDALMEEALAEERRGVGLEESLHEITLDLPEYADRLNIDGTIYFHGRSYTVPMGLFNVMREQVQRMWGHQDEIDGKRSDPRKPKGRVMNRHGVVNTTGSLRV